MKYENNIRIHFGNLRLNGKYFVNFQTFCIYHINVKILNQMIRMK